MIIGADKKFVFDKCYTEGRTLFLTYTCGVHNFTEKISFSEPIDMDTPIILRAVQLLHLIAGVSYYKSFVNDVDEMDVSYPISQELADFLNDLYENGLGEFYYKNALPPVLRARFSGSDNTPPPKESSDRNGFLIGLGGGKDSIVGIELLKKVTAEKILSFGVNASSYLRQQSKIAEIDQANIDRSVDTESISKLRREWGGEVPNGHVPISAILMAIGLIEALQRDFAYLVSGVERSANEPTLKNYMGKDINHQYSKSLKYQRSFNQIIKTWVGSSVHFFSILRPFAEIGVMDLFIKLGLNKKYQKYYSSCNKTLSFTNNSGEIGWCGDCQKCAFIFLLMSASGAYEEAVELFGRDLIGDPKHYKTYSELLGLTESKPFECVGEINESRFAMEKAKLYSKAASSFTFPKSEPIQFWVDEHLLPNSIADKLRVLTQQIVF